MERVATPNPAADPELLARFAFKVWSYKQGEIVSLLLHIGDRLGLFAALDDAAAGTGLAGSADLAEATGLNERLLREWLYGVAAAGLVEHDDGAFALTPEARALLVDEEDSVHFAMGVFRGGTETAALELILDSFRTGVGMTYEQQGPRAAAGLARTTGPFSRQALTSTILAGLDGVVAKLADGAKVIDVGCGAGVSSCLIAAAWPASHVVGFDPSPTAVDQARARAAAAHLDNAEFVVAGAADIPASADTDLALTFDCLHDMPRPDDALAAIRAALADDGTLLVKDIRSRGDFDHDRRNPLLAMFYGFSVSSCLQSALSEPGGMGLGTLGLHPAKARELTAAAGFTRFAEHDFDDAANLYYEVRP
ncbi:MAG TPA: SAM-dependent methyltransferase [Acidimicrobiaceae bacterium]|nr:SAM-dependent methyltransferase [Acidimicrobiaceae bacterium]HCB36749.1 SAM-dependent methyltransferase [Acidimicrobiaceae bacterium]